MTTQLDLFAEDVRRPVLVCAFGEPWMGPHPLCEAETDRKCARFEAAVLAGTYDAQGYTPNERKAMARKGPRG